MQVVSPIHLLCQVVPPPPPTVPALLPPLPAEHTTREHFLNHTADPMCLGCHTLMDPVGFGFENFDAFGRFRTAENGYTIDASGQINDVTPDAEPVPFADLTGLAATLSHQEAVQQCVTRMVATYALGQDQTAFGGCASVQLKRAASQGSLRELFTNFVGVRDFYQRAD